MKQKMFIHYDAEGDYLEVRFGKPTPAYYIEIGNDTFERRDEKTNKTVGYSFFNVQKRGNEAPRDIEIEIPVVSS